MTDYPPSRRSDRGGTLSPTCGELHYNRTFKAPRELVFKYMSTTPEHLTHFWGPFGVGRAELEEASPSDLRPGGRVRDCGPWFNTKTGNEVSDARHLRRRGRALRAGAWVWTEADVEGGITPPLSPSSTSATAGAETVTHQTNVPDQFAEPRGPSRTGDEFRQVRRLPGLSVADVIFCIA